MSGDIRDLQQAAASGHPEARLALEVYVSDVRRYLGGLLVELGGADALVFTGGIGENGVEIRSAVCRDLGELGIELDEDRNQAAPVEGTLHTDSSRVQIWIVPTNEELVVARQTQQLEMVDAMSGHWSPHAAVAFNFKVDLRITHVFDHSLSLRIKHRRLDARRRRNEMPRRARLHRKAALN